MNESSVTERDLYLLHDLCKIKMMKCINVFNSVWSIQLCSGCCSDDIKVGFMDEISVKESDLELLMSLTLVKLGCKNV